MLKNLKKRYKRFIADAVDLSSVRSELADSKKKIEELSILNKELSDVRNAINTLALSEEKIQHSIDEIHSFQKYLSYYSSTPELLRLMANNKTDKKRILLCGNYGDTNLGDELMMQTLIDAFSRELDCHLTVMIYPRINYENPNLQHVSVIHFPYNYADISVIANCFDVVVVGGGALLEDEAYSVRELHYDNFDEYNIHHSRAIIDICNDFIEHEKPVFCLGLSTSKNVFQNKNYLKKLSQVAEKAKVFSLRDTNSINTLKKSGIDISNVKLCNDLVYASDYLTHNVSCASKEKRKIGVITLCYDQDCTKKVIINLVNSINDEYGEENTEITLIPFYKGIIDDEKFFNELVSKNGWSNVIVPSYYDVMSDLSKLLCEQDIIVSSRYHGILMSLALGVPTIPVIMDLHPHYYNKVEYLLRQYGAGIEKTINFGLVAETPFSKMVKENVVEPDNSVTERLLKETGLELEEYIAEIKRSCNY